MSSPTQNGLDKMGKTWKNNQIVLSQYKCYGLLVVYRAALGFATSLGSNDTAWNLFLRGIEVTQWGICTYKAKHLFCQGLRVNL